MALRGKYSGTRQTFFDSVTHETALAIAPIAFYDDFFAASSLVIPAFGSAESGATWVKKIVGAAPPLAALKANAGGGALLLTFTADSQAQTADITMNDQRSFDVSAGLVFEARFRLTTLPTLAAEFCIGLIAAWAADYDTIAHSIFFTCDGGGLITCESDDSATDVSTSSGVTLIADEWAVVRFDCSDVTSIKWYVNGNQVAASATHPYADTAGDAILQPLAGLYKASGAGLGVAEVDYIRIWSNR